MSGIFDEFGGSLTADVLEFNPDAILEPYMLVIRMTRGEHRIADVLRKEFGGFKRVAIDVDDERHEFGADSLIRLLEDYEDMNKSYGQVPEQGKHGETDERESCSRYSEFFGTPERAAQTLAKACGECYEYLPCCECPLYPMVGRNVYEPEILEWLRGDAE